MLIRFILAIPLALVLIVLGIGASFVVIIGWFGALFTGRLPNFARSYLVRYLKITLNLYVYLYLLSDISPPFEADVPGYPVHMAVPAATKLSRWAVFFRFILFIPASIASTAVSYGLGILSFFLWLITLCTGWLPLSAHNAWSAVIRYQVRLAAYVYLVVPTYPNGLFGDGVPLTTRGSVGEVAPPSMVEAMPSFGTAEPVTPAGDMLEYSGSPAEPPALPATWRLVLNRGARRLLVVAIIVGALGYVGQLIVQSAVISHANDQTSTLDTSIITLESSFGNYDQHVRDCPTGGAQVACVEGAAGTLSSQLRHFADSVSGLNVSGLPPDAIASAASEALTCAGIFERLANAGPSAAAYLQVVQSVGLQGHLNQLQSDLNVI